jgi:hypothetical protein
VQAAWLHQHQTITLLPPTVVLNIHLLESIFDCFFYVFIDFYQVFMIIKEATG